MSIENLPPELVCSILRECSFDERLKCQTLSSYVKDCSRDIEKDLYVYFDGSGSSVRNIFYRHDKVKRIHMLHKDYETFINTFGKDHGFSVYVYN